MQVASCNALGQRPSGGVHDILMKHLPQLRSGLTRWHILLFVTVLLLGIHVLFMKKQ